MSHSQPTSILYDARTVRPAMGGVGRYTLNLLWALSVHPEAPPIRALFAPEAARIARRDPALANVQIVDAPFSHEQHPRADIWLEWTLPKMLQPGELYHGPAFIIPGGRRRFSRVVTIHDLFAFDYPHFYPWRFGLWLRWAVRRACRCADLIIAPSESTAQLIVARRLANRDRIRVISEAPDDTHAVWDKDSLNAGGLVAGMVQETLRPMIVSIGTLDPRKDPATARAAHLELCQRLRQVPVAAVPSGGAPGAPARFDSIDWIWLGGAGARPDPTSMDLRLRASEAGFYEVGHVPKEAIRSALRSASVFVTTSRAEGFGIPLIEAMVAGCPIIASNIPVHHEICGDAALYFPPGDPKALAAVIYRLLTKPTLRERLVQRGFQRQNDFRWSLAAAETLAVYHEAAESGRRPKTGDRR
jgi:glycosyltransferase involved in cell wall biosynthesis